MMNKIFDRFRKTDHTPSAGDSEIFRKFLKFNQAVKIKAGFIHDNAAGSYKKDKTFNVGIRFALPEAPTAVRRVWLAFDTNAHAREFADIAKVRLQRCSTDGEYNAEINKIIDEIRGFNPDVPEEIAASDDGN